MADVNVTDKVEFGNNDDELLPIKKCVCGEIFPLWEFSIGLNKPAECPKCGRKLFFSLKLNVYECESEEPEEASKTKCAICGEEITKDSVTGYVWNKIFRPGGPKYDEEYICFDCFSKKFIEHMKSNDQLPTS
jgi:DNA-directed RNA polymerase subunit RPC12/RpoP